MKHSSIHDALAEALADLALSQTVLDGLALHFKLLVEWNPRVNLTAILDPTEAAWLHYRDALEGLQLLVGSSLVDLGSGGGFPGVPLALASGLPTLLVEPRRKRASFLRVVASRLGARNITVREGRSEDPPTPADTVVTRATFSSEADLHACLRWTRPGGRLLTWRNEPLDGADFVHTYTLLDQPRVITGFDHRSVGAPI